MTEKSIVGDLINFRGLVYAPLNENGVVFLFGKVAEDLNMYVEEIKPGFPDCVARRFTGKGWERVRVEFEFTSGNFKQHGHDPDDCDVIICWRHDWDDCPIEVIELRDRIKGMENKPVERPDKAEPAAGTKRDGINAWFKAHGANENVRRLFTQLSDVLQQHDGAVFHKVARTTVSFYSPERTFLYVPPRKTVLRMWVFTGGEPLGKVKQFQFESGANKWGGLSVRSDDELQQAIPWIIESCDRVREAVRKNEPTGWFAKADTVDAEDAELDREETDDEPMG